MMMNKKQYEETKKKPEKFNFVLIFILDYFFDNTQQLDSIFFPIKFYEYNFFL